MPMTILALDIPGQEQTDILVELVRELQAELYEGTRLIYSDGVFPTTNQLSGPERLGFYLEHTDPADYALLFDDNYIEALMRFGPEALGATIASPYWLNEMSVRQSFERNRKDFMRLIDQSRSGSQRFK
jgi:hypothetical protein